VNQGHEAAIGSYQELLRRNPGDLTAATRIAASPLAPARQDRTCPVGVGGADGPIADLRELIHVSGYDRVNVGRLFGVVRDGDAALLSDGKQRRATYPLGPTYVVPVAAGSEKRPPPLPFIGTKSKSRAEDKAKAQELNSLSCLVSMFLLGFALRRCELEKHLVGGNSSIELLETLGLAFPCEIDPSLVVPYCHLFPMDVPRVEGGGVESIVLATDLHPVAFSRITAGSNEEGTVMYIGPDSLALVQHLPLGHQLINGNEKHRRGRLVLDLCSGSGIQALSTLAALKRFDPTAKAICVDVNERALRFTKFNSMLNGLGDRVTVVKGDLIEGELLPMQSQIANHTHVRTGDLVQTLRSLAGEMGSQVSKGDGAFDIVLSNPPFIPVPPTVDDCPSELTRQSIDLRYGLFSSGGADGESVLEAVLKLSQKLSCGFVGIVSEFMNPSQSLCLKMEQWWADGCDCSDSFSGVLFANEESVDAPTYAYRRANDDEEYRVWLSHLNDSGITSVSPGLLFIRQPFERSRSTVHSAKLTLKHILVPKSVRGSIWTPQNIDAVEFTQSRWSETI